MRRIVLPIIRPILPPPTTCYFLLNYALVRHRIASYTQESMTCYFLLNYALFPFRRVPPCFLGVYLLFSFELCSTLKTRKYTMSSPKNLLFSFELCTAYKYDIIRKSGILDILLFSFELCLPFRKAGGGVDVHYYLAIFFWIMWGERMSELYRLGQVKVLLFSFELCKEYVCFVGWIGIPGYLAIFFWIMWRDNRKTNNTWKIHSTTCYFLLNYVRRGMGCGQFSWWIYNLLFSFELCKSRGICREILDSIVDLLFSFELCLMR